MAATHRNANANFFTCSHGHADGFSNPHEHANCFGHCFYADGNSHKSAVAIPV
jgi:hypothetical protein